jgi:hypothetical protein
LTRNWTGGARKQPIDCPVRPCPGTDRPLALPLFGEVAAELALIGDGGAALALMVTDEAGTLVCAHPASREPGLCRFIPARNGFFVVSVHNPARRRKSAIG